MPPLIAVAGMALVAERPTDAVRYRRVIIAGRGVLDRRRSGVRDADW
jgi:hypothetical protein